MEGKGRDDAQVIDRLVELTSDAVAVCRQDGTVLHANAQLLSLLSAEAGEVIGTDVKDLLFSSEFERSQNHVLPFPLDGSDCRLLLKLRDGSFIPVLVRAFLPPRAALRAARGGILNRILPREHLLVVIHSLEEHYAYDRQMRRVLTELQAANKRLTGTLSVIMSTVGADDLNTLLSTVLNELVEALDADGSTIYFAEAGGFKLRGVSRTLLRDYVPEFIPYGVGIPTMALRRQGACRMSISPADENRAQGSFYDLDTRARRRLRMQDTPPFKALIAVPVYYGSQLLGVMELGWKRPHTPRKNDVRVLEVVCEYLSFELVGLVAAIRSRRSAELNRSLGHLRDTLYNFSDDRSMIWGELTSEIRRVLSCYVCPVVYDRATGGYLLDFEGGDQIALPGDVDSLFFATTVPAAHMSPGMNNPLMYGSARTDTLDELEGVRLTRIERTSPAGAWLESRGLPNQGVFLDMGDVFLPLEDAEEGFPSAWDETGRDDDAPAGHMGASGQMEDESASHALSRMVLLLRDASQEPIDDVEYDYLARLAHECEQFTRNAIQQRDDRQIAQALQVGMRNALSSVPGIETDSLYSSATRQALVGGDFYTLLRLPDDRAVMILGDVSGKGVEAASMSALVKTALTAYAWEGASPVRMVRSLNTMLMSFSRVETFATMFVAKIDLRRRRAEYCSAGHPPSMLIRAGASGAERAAEQSGARADGRTGELAAVEIELLSAQSGVVGAFESMVFKSGTFSFEPGDMLFMYTDGAIEARNAAGEFFGEQRLRDVLLRMARGGVQGLCQSVLQELDKFSSSQLEDDIALAALRFGEL